MESTNREPEADPLRELICLVCRERPAAIRGQCRRCRQGTSRAVNAGRTTEQALLDRGLLLPSCQGIAHRNTVEWRRKLAELRVAVEVGSGSSHRAPAKPAHRKHRLS